jgi:alcohol dehydrogenase
MQGQQSPALSRLLAAGMPARFSAVAAEDPRQKMAAVLYRQHGPPAVLEHHANHPRPLPAAGQSLVRINAVGVNPVDFKVRSFNLPRTIFPLPKIPGTDFAGEVIEPVAGGPFRAGDRVFGMMPLLGTPWGSCGEYAAVEDRFLAPLPQSLDPVGAASLPLVALTVVQALDHVIDHSPKGLAGRRILIQAGSGGLGTFAIQYCARVLGMEVATTCSASSFALVRSLGATTLINYRDEDFLERIRDYDVVFDPLGHRYARATLASNVLKPQGHYLHIAGSDWPPQRIGRLIPEASPLRLVVGKARQYGRNTWTAITGRGPHYHLIFVHPDGDRLRRVAHWVDEGKIRPVIDRRFSLAATAAAHRYLEQGHARGKVVITL